MLFAKSRLLLAAPLLALLASNPADAAVAAPFTPPKFVIGVWLQPNYKLADWRQRGINTAFGYETLGGDDKGNYGGGGGEE